MSVQAKHHSRNRVQTLLREVQGPALSVTCHTYKQIGHIRVNTRKHEKLGAKNLSSALIQSFKRRRASLSFGIVEEAFIPGGALSHDA